MSSRITHVIEHPLHENGAKDLALRAPSDPWLAIHQAHIEVSDLNQCFNIYAEQNLQILDANSKQSFHWNQQFSENFSKNKNVLKYMSMEVNKTNTSFNTHLPWAILRIPAAERPRQPLTFPFHLYFLPQQCATI